MLRVAFFDWAKVMEGTRTDAIAVVSARIDVNFIIADIMAK